MPNLFQKQEEKKIITTPTEKVGGSLNLFANAPEPVAPVVTQKPIVPHDITTSPFAGTLQNLANLQTDPLALKTVKEGLATGNQHIIMDHFKQTFKDAWKNLESKQSKTGFGGFLSKATAGAGVFFSPISALFKVAEDVPVVGTGAKFVNTAFGAIDEAVKAGVNELPIKNKQLKEGIGDILGLAGQIALAKVGDVGMKKIGEMKVKYGEKNAKAMIDKATELAEQHKSLSQELIDQTKNKNKIEPSKEELNAQFEEARTGTKPEVIPVEEATQKITEAVQEAQKPVEAPIVEHPEITKAVEEVTKPETKPIEEIERPILENDMRVTKAASDINRKLVEQGIEQLPPEEQAQYKTGSYKADKESVIQLMDKDIEKAKAIATGKEPVPAHIRYPQILFNTLKIHARVTGDTRLSMELAKSPFATERSEAAGTLGSSGFNNDSMTPADLIQKANKRREEAIVKKSGKSIKSTEKEQIIKLKKSARKTSLKRQDWESFVKSIQC